MGPWSVRRTEVPTVVGCSYETLLRMVQSGDITRDSIVRGPSTKQLWQVARRVPGIAHLVGSCHQCRAKVERRAGAQPPIRCGGCGANFGAYLDRNWYGLPEINPLPDDPSLDSPERGHPRGMTMARSASLSSFVEDDDLLVPEVDGDTPRNAQEAAARMSRAAAMTASNAGSVFARPPSERGDDESSNQLLTVMERTLLDRTARLERTNRILLGTTIVCFIIAFALTIVFLIKLRES